LLYFLLSTNYSDSAKNNRRRITTSPLIALHSISGTPPLRRRNECISIKSKYNPNLLLEISPPQWRRRGPTHVGEVVKCVCFSLLLTLSGALLSR